MRPFHLFAGALLLSPGISGCDFPLGFLDGSGHEGREAREVAAFSAVHVAGSLTADVTLAPDAPQSVEVSGDDNLVPHVRTRVDNGALILELPPSFGIHPKLPLVVTVSATALSGVGASDSARMVTNQVDGEGVTISASDSAELTVQIVTAGQGLTLEGQDSATVTLGEVSVSGTSSLSVSDSAVLSAKKIAADGELSVSARDSSDVVLAGEAPVLIADLSDSSHLDAADLTVSEATVVASSSSEADVCVTATLDVTLSDSSEVRYACDPDKILKDIDDSSTLVEK